MGHDGKRLANRMEKCIPKLVKYSPSPLIGQNK